METFFELSLYWIIALSLIAFAAAYIDAVAGGGMLNLPALLFAGVPPVSALAVNKMTGIAGTSLAVIKGGDLFIRKLLIVVLIVMLAANVYKMWIG